MATFDYDANAKDIPAPSDRPAWVTADLIDLTLGLTGGTEAEAVGLIVAFWQVLAVVWKEQTDEALHGNRSGE